MKPASSYRPVLILGSAPRISVPVARSLHRHGIPVEVASFQPEEPRLHSRAIRAFHRLPSKDQPREFLQALASLVRERGFDMMLPAGDPALAAMAQHYGELRSLLHLGCPPPHVVERVLNKALTLEIARQCGINVPLTATVATPAELGPLAAQLRFPVVAKPRERGRKSFKVMYFNSLPALSAFLEGNLFGPILLQEYCPGEGIGVEMLMRDGQCVAHFQHRRLKEAPATGGVAAMAIAEAADPALYQASLALLRALEWEGVAMVEFRADPASQRAVLMEVNGRYWGTCSLPILAGVDFPLYHWQLAHGEELRVPAGYAVGMRWRWTAGCFDRLHGVMTGHAAKAGLRPSRWKELARLPLDLSPAYRDALWSFADPLPALADLARSFREFAFGDAKWLLKKLLPLRVKKDVDMYRRLGPQAGPVYARLRTLDTLHMSLDNRRKVARGARNFVFVCHGNIMRSPMAEAMFKRALVEHGVDGVSAVSAGMHARPSREAHPRARLVSREIGIPLDHHRAQPVTGEMVAQADAIFAMDFENKSELLARYPEARLKVFLMSAYAEGARRYHEIPDPYFGDEDEVRRCYAVLKTCVHNLVRDLWPVTQVSGQETGAAH